MENGRILFDDGSQKSHITKELANKLKLKPITKKNVVINGACATSTVKTCDVVRVAVQTTDPNIKISVIARVLEEICHPISHQPIRTAVRDYPHLQGLKFADYHLDGIELDIDLLVGGDFYYSFVSNVTKSGEGIAPVAVKSKVGWLLSGPVESKSTHSYISSVHMLKCTECPNYDTNLSDTVGKFWDLETIGIRNDENSVLDSFLDSIKYDEGHMTYEVSLPWKSNHPYLPDNYSNATRRLATTFNRLKRNPDVLKKYHETIMDQLDKNMIETCEPTKITNKIHYLPHREVIREDKTSTKLRIVYDASSKLSKFASSLNDYLYKGHSLSQLMLDVLLRFWLHRTAFVCDLQKAFLQIRMNENDRNVLRFLWFKDPFVEDPEIIMYRFACVLFGLNCAPFLLNGTIKHHLSNRISGAGRENTKIILC